MKIDSAVTLNNGVHIPQLGLGVYMADEGAETEYAVRAALDVGYRHIDTAKAYKNEASVGKAIRESNIPREKIFVTTKLWNPALRAGNEEEEFYGSLRSLGLDYIDLYLIHWPVREGYVRAWSVMEKLYGKGLIRSIGLSNFNPHHLDTLEQTATVTPAINQIELHPLLTQDEVCAYFRSKNIAIEAWSPLGRGALLANPTIVRIAGEIGRTPAQVLLRWHLQRGHIVIPKSVRRERITENAALFDFALNDRQMNEISALNRNERFGPDPDNFNF
ncbi:MAG: aldo/keto reductase [Oscillospiraceae bacterium]|jgi:diketogulonate reductase-like aldo/keto reductase|nr:aldo/keto reductase [Oscillospiraceae bacterium]